MKCIVNYIFFISIFVTTSTEIQKKVYVNLNTYGIHTK